MSSRNPHDVKVIAVCRLDRDCAELDAVRDDIDLTIVRTADEYRAALPGAEVLFLNDVRSTLIREVGPGKLKWIHTSGIGIDALLTKEVIDAGVTVTISRGVCERPIAEYVLASLLYFAKDLRTTIESQMSREWVHRDTVSILGRRVLVLGTGPVATEIVLLLRAAGMHVEAFGRRSREDPQLGPIQCIEDLDSWLPKADDVVLALPLNASTAGIMDAKRIDLLSPSANLVNVGRGALVDELALLEALRQDQLAGAALDVFETEPLPMGHPFWNMKNVLVSPHMSGDILGWRDEVVQLFMFNLERWIVGAELQHVINLGEHPVAR